MGFGAALKMNRQLSPRLVELVRLRIAFFNQCRSCMAIRYADARAAGVDEDLVCSLERPAQADNLTPAERAWLDAHRDTIRIAAYANYPPAQFLDVPSSTG